MIMGYKYILILLAVLFSVEVSAQDSSYVDTFIVNDVTCYRKSENGIVVTVAAERIKQFGAYVRLKIEIINLRATRVNFMTDSIKSTIVYDGMYYSPEIYDYDKFVSVVRSKRFFFGKMQKILDNPLSVVYPLDEKDISVANFNSRGRDKYTFGTSNQPKDSLGRAVVERQTNSTINNSDQDRAYGAGNMGMYRLTIDRNYLRSNTLNPNCATGGILMVKRRNGSVFKIKIVVDDTDFDFEWKIDNIKKVKYF